MDLYKRDLEGSVLTENARGVCRTPASILSKEEPYNIALLTPASQVFPFNLCENTVDVRGGSNSRKFFYPVLTRVIELASASSLDSACLIDNRTAPQFHIQHFDLICIICLRLQPFVAFKIGYFTESSLQTTAFFVHLVPAKAAIH